MLKTRETAIPFATRPHEHTLILFYELCDELVVPDQDLARFSLISFPKIGAAFDICK